jgi:uncharacterized protein YecE (DUF72 family)
VILVGTSGFHFADWKDVFYPSHLKKSEWLQLYVRHFPTLEINSTYYRIPSRTTFESFDKRTPDGYPIVLKTHSDVTHARVDMKWSIGALLESAAPLVDSGKLSALLAQFPYNFRNTDENRTYLSDLRGAVPQSVPLFVEFRRSDWATSSTFTLLRNEGIGFCGVDEPELSGLMPRVVEETNGTGYVRLHGRNEKSWWGDSGDDEGKGGGGNTDTAEKSDRYDHLYSEDELREWVEKVKELQKITDKTFVFFNNCFAGQAVRGAKLMQAMLDIPRTGEEQVRLDL